MLKVQNVSKSYGAHRALDSISFRLESGFYALLGPNGAGKSTLFQLLTGLFTPDQGEITVLDIDIKQHLPQVLAQIGVVFQQMALDLDLTVQANLQFYGLLHGLSKAEIKQRSHEELERLGLNEVLTKTCRSLSGGNRRKVELARALLTHPKVLLMDEATVGLDPASRESLLSQVHDLCVERQMCILWATHLIDEAEQAKQVLILHKGKLLEQDSPEQIVQKSGEADLLAAFLKLSGQQSTMSKPLLRSI